MILNFKLLAQSGDHSIVKVGTIIHNDSSWDTIPTDKVVFDEPGHDVLSNGSK